MGKYTTELYKIIDNMTNKTSIKDKINEFSPKLFDFEYSLFDDSRKSEIEEKIIKHYYTREIGFETYNLFKLKFETKFLEILPEINELYKSTSLKYDPLINFKTSENIARAVNQNDRASSTTTTNEEQLQKMHDTPTTKIVEDKLKDYMTTATIGDNKTDSETLNENINNTNEDVVRTTEGVNASSVSSLVIEYRNAILNVDMVLIEYLNDLFINLW